MEDKFIWNNVGDLYWDSPSDTYHAISLMIRAQIAILFSQIQTAATAYYATSSTTLKNYILTQTGSRNTAIQETFKSWERDNNDHLFLAGLMTHSDDYSKLLKSIGEKILLLGERSEGMDALTNLVQQTLINTQEILRGRTNTPYHRAVLLVKAIRSCKDIKTHSIADAIRYIRSNLSENAPFYEQAMTIRAEVKAHAKNSRDGEDKAWRSIAKMSQPSFTPTRSKSKMGRIRFPSKCATYIPDCLPNENPKINGKSLPDYPDPDILR